jgi:hypothetical protein
VTGFSPRQALGLAAEHWALGQLQARGYSAALVSDWLADTDIFLEGCCPVEVKTARATWQRAGRRRVWRQRWQWDLARLPQGVDSLVILIAEDDSGRPWVFVLPSWLLWGRRTIQITSRPDRYRGWLSPYLEAWPIVEQVLAERRRRLAGQLAFPLFAAGVK